MTRIFTDDGAETNVRETPAEVGLAIDNAKAIDNTSIILTGRQAPVGFVIARIVRWQGERT